MDSWSNYLERPETSAEGRLYQHLLQQVKDHHPADAIDLFRQLFIEGVGYSNEHISKDLEWILKAGFVDKDFKFILNRSCYIYINSWWGHGSHRVFIPELIETFEALPTTVPYSFTEKRLRQLVKDFIQTEQYQALRRAALAMKAEWEQTQYKHSEKPLETIINRYPYVYEHNLLTRDSTLEQRRTVRAMRQEAQHQFDMDLSRYIARLALNRDSVLGQEVADKNPTLLAAPEFDQAVYQFTGKVDGQNTHRDLAKRFLTYSQWTRSYRDFKRDLYGYLTPAISSRFGKHHFNRRLERFLQEILGQYDAYTPNDSLIEETCKKLINFLVVENPQHPDHANFIDLIGNVGATLTVALLLKVVLLCRQAKPWLEKRFSILFNHYAPRPKRDVVWLVEALENANIAFSTNFSRA